MFFSHEFSNIEYLIFFIVFSLSILISYFLFRKVRKYIFKHKKYICEKCGNINVNEYVDVNKHNEKNNWICYHCLFINFTFKEAK